MTSLLPHIFTCTSVNSYIDFGKIGSYNSSVTFSFNLHRPFGICTSSTHLACVTLSFRNRLLENLV